MPNTASHWSQPALRLQFRCRGSRRESPVAQFLVVRRHDTFMKIALYISALTIALLAAGCSQPPQPSQPLALGTVISGRIWEHQPNGTSNSAADIPKDLRVDVYDHVIIIYLVDGSRQIAPLDLVTDLKLK